LGAALHLKHADGVALLQGLIDQGIVLWKLSEIDFLTPMVPDKPEAILAVQAFVRMQELISSNKMAG
jgi:hypothetical protein